MFLDRAHAIFPDLVFILNGVSANGTVIEILKVCIETTGTHKVSTTEVDSCPGTLEAYGASVVLVSCSLVFEARFGHAIFAT